MAKASGKRTAAVTYANSIDYLLASILYLGTHEYYWARSPQSMARELSLEESKLLMVFDTFSGIFRKSVRVSSTGQHYYALQARYAQREGGGTEDPEEISWIKPLDVDQLKMLTDFIVKMSEQEQVTRRTILGNLVSVAAALVAAAAAVTTAFLKR